jgi:hypothetical protein
MIPRAVLAVGIAGLLLPPWAHGQTTAERLASGVRAYQDLEFDRAAGLLRRATDSGARLTPDELARGLAYLGATEVFREQLDSAHAVFGRLVRLDPRHRIDGLIFPPEVTNVFERVRRQVRAIAVTLPDSATFRAGQPGLVLDLFPSALHQIRVEIQHPDGSVARTVYSGLIGDSLRVEWDGRVAGGAPLPPGRYVLAFSSLDGAGGLIRVIRVPLSVALTLGDTLPHPLAPPDSLLLPERGPTGPALRALIGGLAVGLAVAIAPSVVASEADLSPTRFLVGASVSMASVSTFFALRPGRPLANNITANDRARATWRLEVDRVAQHNEALRRAALVHLRLGPRQVVEREGS